MATVRSRAEDICTKRFAFRTLYRRQRRFVQEIPLPLGEGFLDHHMTMKWAIAILTLTSFGLILQVQGAQEPTEVRVGIIGPQSSGTVGAAEQQESGIRAAIEEARTRWGIRVRVEACDDQSDPQRTLACAQKLEKQGVVVIIGSVNSLCTLELPKVAAELHVPIVSAISTASRLTRTAPVSDSRPTWFFRAALSDRYQMHWLAQWLADFRSLKPDEVAFVFEDSNCKNN